jgi:hypothetical protein
MRAKGSTTQLKSCRCGPFSGGIAVAMVSMLDLDTRLRPTLKRRLRLTNRAA